jgi:hypothetical protein
VAISPAAGDEPSPFIAVVPDVEHLDDLANHRRVGEHIQFLKGALEGR